MNYILEQKIGWRDVIEHNTTTREIVKLFDDRYNTVTKIPDGENYLYLKVPYHDMQFAVFHNISASKIKIRVLDDDGTLLEEKEKETERLISRPIINGGEMIKSFYDINTYLETAPVQNSGTMEIYIYPLNGTGHIGRIDFGIPEFLGCLNWDFSQNAKAVSIPKQLNGSRDSGETNLLSWDNTYSVAYSVFKDASSEDDPSAAYLKSRLSSLFSAKYRRLEFADIDGTNNYLNDWVMKKVTFIDPFATKQAGLFSLEGYSFNGKNSIVSEARVTLRGWIDNRDSIKFEDEGKQNLKLYCVNSDGSQNCTENLFNYSTDFPEAIIANPIHLKEYSVTGEIFCNFDVNKENKGINFYFESCVVGELDICIKVTTANAGDYASSFVNPYLSYIRAGRWAQAKDFFFHQDQTKEVEFTIDVVEGMKYFFSSSLDYYGARVKIELNLRTVDYGQDEKYTFLDVYDLRTLKEAGIYSNIDSKQISGSSRYCLYATSDNAFIEYENYNFMYKTKQITPIFEIGTNDGVLNIGDFHAYLFGNELTINRYGATAEGLTKIVFNTINVSGDEMPIRLELDKKEMTVNRMCFIEWG